MGDELRAVLRRLWDELWRDGDVSVIDELYADRYVRHTSGGTEEVTREQLKDSFVQYQRVLHEPVTTIDASAVEGDVIFCRATSTGANLETGGEQVMTWMSAYRIESGRIVESWIATLPDVDWRS